MMAFIEISTAACKHTVLLLKRCMEKYMNFRNKLKIAEMHGIYKLNSKPPVNLQH